MDGHSYDEQTYFTIFTTNFTQRDNLLIIDSFNGTLIAHTLERKPVDSHRSPSLDSQVVTL